MLLSAVTKTTAPSNNVIAPIKLGSQNVNAPTSVAYAPAIPVAGVVPQLIDSNETPYSLAFAREVTVNVYGYDLPAACEGRIYGGKDKVTGEAVDILKVSFWVKGALVRAGQPNRAIILNEQFAATLAEDAAIVLALEALQNRLYNTLQTNQPKVGVKKNVANIALLGGVGAKFDNKGFPIIYLRETVSVNDAATVGQITAFEVVYSITNMYTNISAYAIIVSDPNISAKSTTRAEQPLRVTSESFNTIEFISDYQNIQEGVKAYLVSVA